MSSYMQALKRTQQVVTPRVEPRRIAREVEAPAVAASAPEVAALLDSLRALAAQGTPARVLVFAPVVAGPAAREVVDALAGRARELRLPVAVAGLARSGGAATLAERGTATRPPCGLDLDGAALGAAVGEWLSGTAAAQLVLIDAPSVLSSIDALLLAGACDGMVLVAESGVTARADLRAAAARVQAAGCRALGVVLTRRYPM